MALSRAEAQRLTSVEACDTALRRRREEIALCPVGQLFYHKPSIKDFATGQFRDSPLGQEVNEILDLRHALGRVMA